MQKTAQNPAGLARSARPIYSVIRPKPFVCPRSQTTNLSVRKFCRNWSNRTCVQPIRKLSGASSRLFHASTASLHGRSVQLAFLRAPILCKPPRAQDDAIGRPIRSGRICCGVFVAARAGALDPDFEFRFSDLFRFSCLGFRIFR